MKSRKLSVLLAIMALIASTLACGTGELSLDNARMATDEAGTQIVTSYSSVDDFIIVAELNNAVKGTIVEVRWYLTSAEGFEAGEITPEDGSSITIEEDYFTGTVNFRLTSDTQWPAGDFQAELYLNGALIHTLNFTVN